MSDPMSTLLVTYRDAIRTYLGLTGLVAERTVAITDDGRPHPAAGQQFYGLVAGGLQNNTVQGYVDATLSLSVVITLRAPYAPSDKSGDELIAKSPALGNPNSGGLLERAWALHEKLKTDRYTLMNAANGLLGGDANTRGFAEPLLLQSISPVEVRGPDWFWAEGQDDAPSGLMIRLSFANARYIDSE